MPLPKIDGEEGIPWDGKPTREWGRSAAEGSVVAASSVILRVER